MKLRFICIALFLLCAVNGFTQEAQTIFKKAIDKLLLNNIELSLDVKEIRKNGRVKEKAFDVLLGKFDEVDKIRMYMKKPDRAKGVTIVVTNTPEETGLIEIYTPANGKVRKMKATAKNLALVGSGGFSSKYLTISPEALEVKIIGKEHIEGESYIKLEILEKQKPAQGKAQLLVEEQTFHIIRIVSYDTDNTPKSKTDFSDFQFVSGTNKIYPRKIITTETGDSSKTEIKILQVIQRADVKESDFFLQKNVDED